jgi:hypothetical protein
MFLILGNLGPYTLAKAACVCRQWHEFAEVQPRRPARSRLPGRPPGRSPPGRAPSSTARACLARRTPQNPKHWEQACREALGTKQDVVLDRAAVLKHHNGSWKR